MGISSEFRGTYQIKPRYADDFVTTEDDGNGKDPGEDYVDVTFFIRQLIYDISMIVATFNARLTRNSFTGWI